MTRRALPYLLSVVLLLALVAPPAAVGGAEAKPKFVGTVVSVGGSKKLGGGGARLTNGADLTLGEQLVMGKGLRATLRLIKPKGVGDRNLVNLRSVKNAKLDVSVLRQGAKIIVVISPT